ncbi:MAG: hypothetical protein RLZZ212_266 [Actinomycetota bacterium]
MSHNPIFNQAVRTGMAASEMSPTQVDQEFGRITGTKMTMEGTTSKVIGMFLAVLIGAAATWFFGLYAFTLPAMFVGLGLGLWASFSKTVRPGVMLAYALVQGVFIGGLSGIFEQMYPGIVQTAVIGTFATAGAMFLAYRFGWVKVDARFTRFMTFALIGYFVFAMVNLGFALFAGASIYSSPFGWLVALVGVGLAAFTLNLDFETIRLGIQEGWAEDMEWRAAFGLTASLLWLYVEIIRLLSIFNQE